MNYKAPSELEIIALADYLRIYGKVAPVAIREMIRAQIADKL